MVELRVCLYYDQTISSEWLRFYCRVSEHCCAMACCLPSTTAFWKIWYFWFIIFFLVFFCILTGWCCKGQKRNRPLSRRGPDIQALTNYLQRWQRTNNRSILNQRPQQPGAVSSSLHDQVMPNLPPVPTVGSQHQMMAGQPAVATGVHPAPVTYNYRNSANPMYPFHPADYLGLRNDPRYADPLDSGPGIQLHIPSGIDINHMHQQGIKGVQGSNRSRSLEDSSDYASWDAITMKRNEQLEQHYTSLQGQHGAPSIRKRSSPEVIPPMVPPGAMNIEDTEDDDSVDYDSQPSIQRPRTAPPNDGVTETRRSGHLGPPGERKPNHRITLPPISR